MLPACTKCAIVVYVQDSVETSVQITFLVDFQNIFLSNSRSLSLFALRIRRRRCAKLFFKPTPQSLLRIVQSEILTRYSGVLHGWLLWVFFFTSLIIFQSSTAVVFLFLPPPSFSSSVLFFIIIPILSNYLHIFRTALVFISYLRLISLIKIPNFWSFIT